MKKCEKFLELLSSSIDGKTSFEEEKILREHLRDCEECRRAKEELLILKNELKKIDIPVPERIRLKKLQFSSSQKFPYSNYFAYLFALIIFITIFFLWQNIITGRSTICLEIREKAEDHFPVIIKTIKIKDKLPDDFFMEIEANFKEKSIEMYVIKTNYKEKNEKILKYLKNIEFDGFENKKYYFKIYKCP